MNEGFVKNTTVVHGFAFGKINMAYKVNALSQKITSKGE